MINVTLSCDLPVSLGHCMEELGEMGYIHCHVDIASIGFGSDRSASRLKGAIENADAAAVRVMYEGRFTITWIMPIVPIPDI